MFWESQSSAFWFQASGVHVLGLSLKSPSSTWTGALGPTEGLRGLCRTVCVCVPRGEARTLPYACTVSSYPLSLCPGSFH